MMLGYRIISFQNLCTLSSDLSIYEYALLDKMLRNGQYVRVDKKSNQQSVRMYVPAYQRNGFVCEYSQFKRNE